MRKNKHIIIIGGGFGGAATAKKLAKHGFEVTLFDKRNHFVFQPLLYQVATSMLSPAQIAYPIRAMFKKQKNVRVLIGNVVSVDKEKKTVSIKRSSQTFTYDYHGNQLNYDIDTANYQVNQRIQADNIDLEPDQVLDSTLTLTFDENRTIPISLGPAFVGIL